MKLNQWCHKQNVSLLWGQVHSTTLSVFCYPDLSLIDSFQGENPRPENDLLLSQHISLDDNDDNLHVTCTKKHFLTSDDEVHLSHYSGSKLKGRIEVINDKEFLMKKTEKSFKCCDDETYLVKLMKRSCSSNDKYLLFNESLKNPSFSPSDPNCQVALHNQRTSQNETEEENYSGLLGSILGCEIYSSMIKKARLPMHQWLHVDLSSQEKKTKKKDEVGRIIVLSKNLFSDCLKNVLKKSFEVEVMDCDEFLNMSDLSNALVICCGETYEKRR